MLLLHAVAERLQHLEASSVRCGKKEKEKKEEGMATLGACARRGCLGEGKRASESLSWCHTGSGVRLWPGGKPGAVCLP